MGWIIITILVGLLIVGAIIYSRGARRSREKELIRLEATEATESNMRAYPVRDAAKVKEDLRYIRIGERSVVGGLIVLWFVMTFFASAHQIEAGHVGVVYQFGSIEGQISEGLQFTAPWQGVKVADIRVLKATFERMTAASNETQDVYVTATMNYSVSPNAIQNLYRTVGPNWFDRLVSSRMNNFFKDETVKYKAVDIIPNREAIRTNVRTRLVDSLQPYSITVVDLLIDNIAFNPGFTKAIEDKQIATQTALREQELVKQVEYQAQQRRAEAEGIADATRIEAQGQADANRVLNNSLSPALIQYTAIQRLSDNIQLMLVPDSGNFLFNLNPQALNPGG